jgi:integrase
LLRLEKHFGPECKVNNLTTEMIDSYRAARKTDESQPNEQTINRDYVYLKMVLNYGVKKGWLKRMPHIDILSETHRSEDGEFTQAQFAKLLTALPALVQPLARFVYATGMRISEPLGLRWHEVDVERAELRINGRRTKNGTQKVLYLAGAPLAILKAQAKKRDGEFVFHNDGKPITYDRAIYYFQTAYDAVKGSPQFQDAKFTDADGESRTPGWHDLRRTFARNARRAGVADSEIMNIAGWKTHAMLLAISGRRKQKHSVRLLLAWERHQRLSNLKHVIFKFCQGRRGDGMADVTDLKSVGGFPPCGFDSRPRHHRCSLHFSCPLVPSSAPYWDRETSV